jgi:hypothetical protein
VDAHAAALFYGVDVWVEKHTRPLGGRKVYRHGTKSVVEHGFNVIVNGVSFWMYTQLQKTDIYSRTTSSSTVAQDPRSLSLTQFMITVLILKSNSIPLNEGRIQIGSALPKVCPPLGGFTTTELPWRTPQPRIPVCRIYCHTLHRLRGQGGNRGRQKECQL